eukprot:gb/GECG01002064.1/.p1 GENE.gb/GECG01002064.1/~~gb/GECG01002064.1/.p1  ORF type:complete len:752 (+),score=70.30 gb/GECG01002064.1/:1-2256(+)
MLSLRHALQQSIQDLEENETENANGQEKPQKPLGLLSDGKQHGWLHQVFPLHNPQQLHKLRTSWVRSTKYQPLGWIREYFGENVAFYFAFVGFYAWSLSFPALAALAVVLVGLIRSEDSVANTLIYYFRSVSSPHDDVVATRVKGAIEVARLENVLYAVVVVLWSTLFLRLWRRKESHLALLWGVFDPSRYGTAGAIVSPIHPTRTGYKPNSLFADAVRISDEAGNVRYVENTIVRFIRRWGISLPIMVCCIAAAFAFMYLCERLRHYVEEELDTTMKFDTERQVYVRANATASEVFSNTANFVEPAGSNAGSWRMFQAGTDEALVASCDLDKPRSWFDLCCCYLTEIIHSTMHFIEEAFNGEFFEAQELSISAVYVVTMAPTLGYALGLPIIDAMNAAISRRLTTFENHRTQQDHEQSLNFKLIACQLCNNFLGLFYIAFVRQNLAVLRDRLVVLFLVRQLIQNFQEVLLPHILSSLHYEYVKKKDHVKQSLRASAERMAKIQKESELPEYSQYEDVLEMLLQYGYVVLFASVFPLGSIAALLNNVMEVRSDAYKICSGKRPKGEASPELGSWDAAFRFIAHLGVITNVAILGIALAQRDDTALVENCVKLSEGSYCLTTLQLSLFSLGAEHILLLLQVSLWYSLREIPRDVRGQWRKKAAYEHSVLSSSNSKSLTENPKSASVNKGASAQAETNTTEHCKPSQLPDDKVIVPLSVFTNEIRLLPESALSHLGDGLRKRLGDFIEVDLHR